MNGLLSRLPEIAAASTEEKLSMIDELWELVRRSGEVEVPASHSAELDRRVALVCADESLALTPEEARALLRK
jgi:putative addiction module component (TIGR02574 family)